MRKLMNINKKMFFGGQKINFLGSGNDFWTASIAKMIFEMISVRKDWKKQGCKVKGAVKKPFSYEKVAASCRKSRRFIWICSKFCHHWGVISVARWVRNCVFLKKYANNFKIINFCKILIFFNR